MPIDTDSGIHIYDGTESASPYKTMLNLLANSTKAAILTLKAMFSDTAQGAANWLYNSAADIAQRGTVFTAVGWTIDRWYLFARVATTVQRVTLAATDSFFKTKYAVEILATAATNSAKWVQSFADDDVADMRGTTVVFAVPIVGTNSAAAATIAIEKSPTANRVTNTDWTVLASTNVTPGTSGTVAYVSATIPADATAAGIRVSVSTNNNPNGQGVRVSRMTFKPGTTPPTTHQRRGRTIKGEERECYAYYDTSYSAGVAAGTATTAGFICGGLANVTTVGAAVASARFSANMRAIPTITVYSPNTGAINTVSRLNYSSGDTDATAYVDSVGTRGFRVYSAGTSAAVGIGFHYAASAELS